MGGVLGDFQAVYGLWKGLWVIGLALGSSAQLCPALGVRAGSGIYRPAQVYTGQLRYAQANSNMCKLAWVRIFTG